MDRVRQADAFLGPLTGEERMLSKSDRGQLDEQVGVRRDRTRAGDALYCSRRVTRFVASTVVVRVTGAVSRRLCDHPGGDRPTDRSERDDVR